MAIKRIRDISKEFWYGENNNKRMITGADDIYRNWLKKNNIIGYRCEGHSLTNFMSKDAMTRKGMRNEVYEFSLKLWRGLHTDHPMMFEDSEGRVYYTTQPYLKDELQGEEFDKLAELYSRIGLHLEDCSDESWHCPQSTRLFVVTLADERLLEVAMIYLTTYPDHISRVMSGYDREMWVRFRDWEKEYTALINR